MVVSNSLKQLKRTPVKTVFFLVLLVLTVALFMLGFNLWTIAGKNIDKIENTFTTIGTVQQKATRVERGEAWYADTKIYFSHPTYDRIIPPSVLDFDGANYILKPEKRPYYVAYSPDYVVDENPDVDVIADFQTLIAEVQPLEDFQIDHPVRMKVKRIFSGRLDYRDEILFSNHYDPESNPLYAYKTYIMMLQDWSDAVSNEYKYIPAGYPYSTQYTKDGARIEDIIQTDVLWDEVTDNFYETPKGKRWLALIESYNIQKHNIPVIPTQDTNLLMTFYDGDTWISEGRDISSEEHESGEKVCLISKYFAVNNNLNVGDSLRLPLLCADYRLSPAQTYRYDAFFGYPGGSLINANGEIYPVFEDSDYKIVGIYEFVRGGSSSPDYMLGKNAVVIPTASVKNSDENNILDFGPMMGYTTSFQIPNGTSDEYLAVWAKQGITELEINFYDKGYSKIKAGLDAMAATAAILLIAGAVTTLLVLILFCHLFITKQRKRTAIERSLGMTKKQCTASLLTGILVIVIPACIIGSVVSGALSGYAFEQINASQSQDAFDTMFSDWVNSADAELVTDVALDTQVGMEYAYAGALFIPVAVIIALLNIRSNLKSEPLKLLGEKER